MKTAALLLSGLVLFTLASGPAMAEPVRVRLTARVTAIHGATGDIEDKIAIGARVNGTYVYNTNTPNQSPDPNAFGDYRPYANEARVRFAVAGLVFESRQPTQGINIFVEPHTFGTGFFAIDSTDNKPLSNGIWVNRLGIEFNGFGTVTESSALPAVAPDLTDYFNKSVFIEGSAGSGGFTVQAEIEAAELIVTDALTVSPASGTFAANQHFDAAVILPRNANVSNAHALVNGGLLPLTYPGSCQLQPAVAGGKPSLLCPGAHAVLSTAGGEPIEWIVEMSDGSVLTETVTWTLAQ